MVKLRSFVSAIAVLADSLVLMRSSPSSPCSARPSGRSRFTRRSSTPADALVPSLERTDFSVLDNGKPAEVALFSNESQPFTAVVMLDTSASMTANLKLLNRAAEQFLLRLLPVDKAQVGAFNDKIQLSGTFTNDRDELIGALNDLYFGNPTRLNDAIAASLDALKGSTAAASCWCLPTVKTRRAASGSRPCSSARETKK